MACFPSSASDLRKNDHNNAFIYFSKRIAETAKFTNISGRMITVIRSSIFFKIARPSFVLASYVVVTWTNCVFKDDENMRWWQSRNPKLSFPCYRTRPFLLKICFWTVEHVQKLNRALCTGCIRGLREADDSFQGYTSSWSAAVPPCAVGQHPPAYHRRARYR